MQTASEALSAFQAGKALWSSPLEHVIQYEVYRLLCIQDGLQRQMELQDRCRHQLRLHYRASDHHEAFWVDSNNIEYPLDVRWKNQVFHCTMVDLSYHC